MACFTVLVAPAADWGLRLAYSCDEWPCPKLLRWVVWLMKLQRMVHLWGTSEFFLQSRSWAHPADVSAEHCFCVHCKSCRAYHCYWPFQFVCCVLCVCVSWNVCFVPSNFDISFWVLCTFDCLPGAVFTLRASVISQSCALGAMEAAEKAGMKGIYCSVAAIVAVLSHLLGLRRDRSRRSSWLVGMTVVCGFLCSSRHSRLLDPTRQMGMPGWNYGKTTFRYSWLAGWATDCDVIWGHVIWSKARGLYEMTPFTGLILHYLFYLFVATPSALCIGCVHSETCTEHGIVVLATHIRAPTRQKEEESRHLFAQSAICLQQAAGAAFAASQQIAKTIAILREKLLCRNRKGLGSTLHIHHVGNSCSSIYSNAQCWPSTVKWKLVPDIHHP